MYKVLELTAGQMEPLTPYGIIHISYFLVGVFLAVLLGIKLKNVSIKKVDKICFLIGLFLLLSEIYKQLFYTYYIGLGVYQWWIFPFQLCSIPMYLCLLLPFIKNDKIKHSIYIFLMSYNLLGGFISFLEPSGLIHEYISLTIHAFLWHMALVFIGMIIAFNKNIIKKKEDFKLSIFVYVFLCLIAFLINLLFWKVSSGDINMFFVGPKVSSIIVFSTISEKFGWFINDILYMSAMTLGSYLTYLLLINKRIVKKL